MELCNSVISRLLMNSQHGFRQGKSTHTAIMELMKVLFNNLNEYVISSCLFLNYSNTFDTVNHELRTMYTFFAAQYAIHCKR